MSVIVSDASNQDLLITKGAIEEIISISIHVLIENKVINLDNTHNSMIFNKIDALNNDGFRVVGVATKQSEHKDEHTVTDETDLTFIGYLAFLDPPKTSAKKAIIALENNGVKVKVLTGDNALITKKSALKSGSILLELY